MVHDSIRKKVLQFSAAFGLLLLVKKVFGVETAILVGMAINSADINEARELIVGRDSEPSPHGD